LNKQINIYNLSIINLQVHHEKANFEQSGASK
jgi:hypothetical protein